MARQLQLAEKFYGGELAEDTQDNTSPSTLRTATPLDLGPGSIAHPCSGQVRALRPYKTVWSPSTQISQALSVATQEPNDPHRGPSLVPNSSLA